MGAACAEYRRPGRKLWGHRPLAAEVPFCAEEFGDISPTKSTLNSPAMGTSPVRLPDSSKVLPRSRQLE